MVLYRFYHSHLNSLSWQHEEIDVKVTKEGNVALANSAIVHKEKLKLRSLHYQVVQVALHTCLMTKELSSPFLHKYWIIKPIFVKLCATWARCLTY